MDPIYKEMGLRMRYARQNLGMTQEQVAEKIGIEPAYYGLLERGGKVPSLPTLFKIAKCLKIKVSLLTAEEKDENEFTYQNLKGMMEDLSERQRKFVAGLVRDAVVHIKDMKEK